MSKKQKKVPRKHRQAMYTWKKQPLPWTAIEKGGWLWFERTTPPRPRQIRTSWWRSGWCSLGWARNGLWFGLFRLSCWGRGWTGPRHRWTNPCTLPSSFHGRDHRHRSPIPPNHRRTWRETLSRCFSAHSIWFYCTFAETLAQTNICWCPESHNLALWIAGLGTDWWRCLVGGGGHDSPSLLTRYPSMYFSPSSAPNAGWILTVLQCVGTGPGHWGRRKESPVPIVGWTLAPLKGVKKNFNQIHCCGFRYNSVQ